MTTFVLLADERDWREVSGCDSVFLNCSDEMALPPKGWQNALSLLRKVSIRTRKQTKLS